ncbi:MAG: hypothetical protein D6707_03235, partial [Bacteroidetes bacterium]
IYHLQEEFKTAIRYYHYFKQENYFEEIPLKEVNRRIEQSLLAQEMKKNPKNINIINIGKVINTEFSEYVPLVDAKDSVMFFTSRREGGTGNKKDPYGLYFEDIYYSLKKNGEWTEPLNIGAPLNTETHDACVAITPDAKTMLIFRTNKNLMGGDLYITNIKNNQWSEPKLLSENINSKYQEASACFSEDGNVLYFSSNRPGGFGGKDIYRSVRFGNGEWSLPVNLGATINSEYDEDAPFIVNDTVLYFSSKGHQNIGEYDIFKSVLQKDSTWSEPQNLGYPLNSVDDDIYLSVLPDEITAYYSSDKKGGYGMQDIYKVEMLDKSKFLIIAKGKVTDTSGVPLKAKLTVIDQQNHKIQGVFRSNAKNGKFILLLSPNVNYEVVVESKGFQPLTDIINYSAKEKITEINKNFQLIPKL